MSQTPSTPGHDAEDRPLGNDAEHERALFIATKLDALIKQSGRSNNDIARQIKARFGYRISGNQIYNIRVGRSGNPAHFLIQYVAQVLGVSMLYFSNNPDDQRQLEELRQLADLRHQVMEYEAFQRTPEYRIATRAGRLSARGKNAVMKVVDAVCEAENPEDE